MDLSSTENIYPNPGLLYIATFVKEHGFSPGVLNEMNNIRLLQHFLCNQSIPIVGFSINSDNQVDTLRYRRFLKRAYPTVPIILGGPLVRFLDDDLLEKGTVDYLCIGEGEQPVLALLQGNNSRCIPGLKYIDKSERRIVENPPVLLESLDDMPVPDLDLLYRSSRFSNCLVSTSRGCPFACTFCFELFHLLRR